MKTYVFGDSYSVEFNNSNLYPPGHEYCDWKGYVPKKYFHLLSEKFGSTEIINYAMSGNDNDNIFEKFTEVYKNIEQDDLVIFGWTILNRFSICNNLKKGQPDEYLWGSSTGFNEFDWVESAALNKSTKLYYNRIHKLINFINNILVTNKVVHWTWKYEPGNEMLDEKTIKYETNGDVNDFHYNENTHLILYNKMIKEFENSNKISVDLWSEHLFQHQNTSIMMDYKIKKV
jgi:hypothetical protein